MAREFAKRFYSSPAWLKNRNGYLSTLVDTSGHRVCRRDDGVYCYVDEYGSYVPVDADRIVPVGMCERCFARGELRPAKVVHHKIHLTPQNIDDPHVTLAYENFQRLCQDCHAAVHSDTEESRVRFDENGNVVWKEGSDGFVR